jgi:hypothetical protein
MDRAPDGRLRWLAMQTSTSPLSDLSAPVFGIMLRRISREAIDKATRVALKSWQVACGLCTVRRFDLEVDGCEISLEEHFTALGAVSLGVLLCADFELS